ncbi:MAG: glycosyltransferase [Glaciimonas sp.]|nr:glycosyltransferase [Glaciimonas sp.]
MRNILFLGFCVQFSEFACYSKTDKASQVAAWKLESRYIQGLIESHCSVTSVASFAASTYPGNSRILFRFNSAKVLPERTIYSAPFVNLPGVKLLTRFFSTIVLIAVYGFQKRNESFTLVIYSLHQPFLLAGLVAKFFLRCKVYIIVPDMPLLMRTGSKTGMFVRWFKMLDFKILRLGINFVDGASFICYAMRSQFPMLEKKSVVIDGIVELQVVPNCGSQLEKSKYLDKIIILYTGALVESYGVRLLLETVRYLPKEFQIWIAGAGELSGEVGRAAAANSQLRYLGLLSVQELSSIYGVTSLLINPRLLEEDFVKFSFPSKLLEYLVSGIPVLTSRLPSIQIDLIPYLSFIDDLTAQGIASCIQSTCLDGYARSLEIAVSARKYVSDTRSPKNQIKKLLLLMDT